MNILVIRQESGQLAAPYQPVEFKGIKLVFFDVDGLLACFRALKEDQCSVLVR